MASSPRISPPVLMYDGSRMDWDEASYSVDVTVSSGATDVVHRLSGCPELDRLLEAGFAKYAVEVRCPRELRSTTEISDEPQQRVTAGSRRDGEFLVPGIIAVSDSRIGAEGLHWHIRQFCDGVDVPAGVVARPRGGIPNHALVGEPAEVRPGLRRASGLRDDVGGRGRQSRCAAVPRDSG